MAQKTRAQLEALRDSLIRSNGVNGKTTADNLRDFQTAIIESLLNILDDSDQNGGFLTIDSGRVDVAKINAVSPNGSFLEDSGSWKKIPMKVGSSTFSGDGANVTFTIPHTFGSAPSFAVAVPNNQVSSEQFWVNNITPTDFDVVFLIPPPNAANNVVFTWFVGN